MFWCSLMFFLSSLKPSLLGISEQALWQRFWSCTGFICLGYRVVCIQTKGEIFKITFISRLYKVDGVQLSRTTPYHPQCNGQCGHFNWTLHDLLRTLLPEKMKR